MAAATRHVCPICAKDSAPRPQNPAFPFCSPTCKLVDLGRWLDGGYRVPDEADEGDESDSIAHPDNE